MTKHKQPQITIPSTIDVPQTDFRVAPNGVRLYTLDCSKQEVARVSFVFRAGSSLQSKAFCASATANLLSEGTRLYTSHEISEKLDFYGSYFDVSMDRDYSVVTFCSLLKFLSPTLEIASQILLEPAFDGQEIATYCAKRKQMLAVERSKVSHKARELFAQTLFGAEHPYGISSDENLYDSLTREDIIGFYRRHYTGAQCFVVCSGDISESVQDEIMALCAQLPCGEKVDAQRNFTPPHATKYAFSRHEGALQSAIRIGALYFPRSHPDFIAMQVLTTILGGYFGSRLVRNLREEHGYTYGIYSAMVNLEYEGYMAIATEVAAEVTQDAVAQIFAEIERLRTQMVEPGELDMVKNIMVGEVMRIMDGPFGIADVAIENIENGTDNEFLSRFLEEIRGITPERIFALAQKYLDRERFTTVIVGDKDLDE